MKTMVHKGYKFEGVRSKRMGVICSYHLVWWVLSQWEIIAAGLMTNNRVDMFPLRVKSRTLRGLDDEEHTGGKKIIVAF